MAASMNLRHWDQDNVERGAQENPWIPSTPRATLELNHFLILEQFITAILVFNHSLNLHKMYHFGINILTQVYLHLCVNVDHISESGTRLNGSA